MLTKKIVRDLFRYNPKTGQLVWRNPPSLKRTPGANAGIPVKEGEQLIVRMYNKVFQLSKICYIYVNGAVGSERIIHKNGNKLDNRIDNLEILQSRRLRLSAALNVKRSAGSRKQNSQS